MKTVEDIIYDWVYGFTNKSVIWENENSPSPVLPYLTLNNLAFNCIGEDFLYKIDNSELYQSVGNRQLSLSIKYFGRNAIENLDSLYHSINIPEYRNLLLSIGLTFKSMILINDLSEIYDTEYIECANMDLEFYITTVLKPGISNGLDLGQIDSIENKQTVNNTIDSEYTVSIPIE
jgi:hypothetical protein